MVECGAARFPSAGPFSRIYGAGLSAQTIRAGWRIAKLCDGAVYFAERSIGGGHAWRRRDQLLHNSTSGARRDCSIRAAV